MIAKILDLVKKHKQGLFVGLCLVLVIGIGYNIGRILASHQASALNQQNADILGITTGDKSPATGKVIPKTPKTTLAPRDPRVVASKASSSKLYHHPWCSGAQRIKETNKLWFPTENEAISAGYTLAANCPDSY
jgi:hypothetical protein